MNHLHKDCLTSEDFAYPDVTQLPFVDRIRLSPVPASQYHVPDVLIENGGGFDSEMDFVRKVIEPGKQVMNISAGFGTYPWTAAEVGAGGSEWNDVMRDYSSPEIDFMRIGAEVRKEDILKGGVSFLTAHSPLVMLEIKHGLNFHFELIHAFKSLGYDSYRLIPGIGCLAPICMENDGDLLYLNVFLCKIDCAAKLEAKNLLIYRKIDSDSGIKTAPNLWIDYVQKYPYAVRFLQLWSQYIRNNESNLHWRLHQEVLSSFAISQMTQMPAPDRFQALKWSYQLLEDMVQKNPTFSRLMCLVRVASDMGYRERVDIVLSRLIKMMETGDNVSVDEPFLAISSHFEQIDPGQEIGNWCLVSLLETYEQNQLFSAYPDADISLGNLELLKTLPFYNPETEQRRKFIRGKVGLQDRVCRL